MAIAAASAAAGVAPAAGASPTAVATRIGDHPAFVRVVVDFGGGRIRPRSEMVTATDADPFGDGRASLEVSGAQVGDAARRVSGHGVTVSIERRGTALAVRLSAAPSRFKDVSYGGLHAPERLVIDLWKSRPPSAAAQVARARSGCLALTRLATAPDGTIRASGTAHDLFENALTVRLRGANGRILVQKPTVAAAGRWAVRLRPGSGPAQAATLEAVAHSAKDGALVCLVQRRISLGGGRG